MYCVGWMGGKLLVWDRRRGGTVVVLVGLLVVVGIGLRFGFGLG